MELLLSKGASIEATNRFNQTLLHRAAWDGHTSVVELLERAKTTTSLETYETISG